MAELKRGFIGSAKKSVAIKQFPNYNDNLSTEQESSLDYSNWLDGHSAIKVASRFELPTSRFTVSDKKVSQKDIGVNQLQVVKGLTLRFPLWG